MWEQIKLALTALAIIYGSVYAIGFTVALIKHRKEISEAAKQTKVSEDTKVWLILAGMFLIVVLLNKAGAEEIKQEKITTDRANCIDDINYKVYTGK
jgi:prolipoprotein diacylglyceryltransferase